MGTNKHEFHRGEMILCVRAGDHRLVRCSDALSSSAFHSCRFVSIRGSIEMFRLSCREFVLNWALRPSDGWLFVSSAVKLAASLWAVLSRVMDRRAIREERAATCREKI